MEAIFINRVLSDIEIKHIQKMLKANPGIKLYANRVIPCVIQGLPIESIELTTEEKRKIHSRIFHKVIRFGEIDINGKKISDLFTIRKVSLWHYHKFRSYFIVTNLFHEIEIIEKLKPNFEKISCYVANQLLGTYYKSTQVYLHLPAQGTGKLFNGNLFNYLIFFILRILLGSFQHMKLKHANHIIIDHTIKQKILSINTLKPKFGNYNLEYLFEKLGRDFIILDDVEIPKIKSDQKFRLKAYLFNNRRKRIYGEPIIFRALFSISIWQKLKEETAIIKSQYRNIEPVLTSAEDQLILNVVRSLHNSSKYFLFKYYAYNFFFQKYSFHSISSIDENSPRIKSVLDAAKNNNMTTFGIQHGVIHDLQPNYHFTPEDKKRNVTPDYTLVWGQLWQRKLYKQCNYPENTLINTGFIRTDIIPRLKNTNIRNILNLKDSLHVVVFASQPISDKAMRKQVAYDVFSSLREIKESILVVKLHPAETNEIAYYKSIAKEAKLDEVIFTSEIDLYLLLSRANIVVTSFSTVGLESVFFNKPLIIIDPLKQDVQNYYKDGIAFQATDSKALLSYIRKINSGELFLDQKKYDSYLVDQVTKIDGNVSKRCLDFIKTYSKKVK